MSGRLDGVEDVKVHCQYENEEQVTYLRIDAGTRRMGPFDVSRHVNELVRAHYTPIIEKLRKELDDQMKLIDGDEPITSELDLHLGMKKNVGDKIQPNVKKLLQ